MDVLRVGTIICNVLVFGADKNAMFSLGLEIESIFLGQKYQGRTNVMFSFLVLPGKWEVEPKAACGETASSMTSNCCLDTYH